MKLSTVLGTACACVLFTTVSARAATLASYPFTGSSLASTDTNAVSVASDIVLDTGLTDTTRFLTTGGNPGAALRVNGDETATTFPQSNLANDDFTLEITPVSGARLVLDTLTFDTAVSAGLTSNVRIQLSATGTTFTNLGTTTDLTSTTFAAQSFDLTPANATLAAGLPIYIRFLLLDNSNLATAYTAFDNIAVTGSVAALVPEPGTNALLILGALAVVGGVAVRRRATV